MQDITTLGWKISLHNVQICNQSTYTDCDYISKIRRRAIIVCFKRWSKIPDYHKYKNDCDVETCDMMAGNSSHGLISAGNKNSWSHGAINVLIMARTAVE